MSHLEISFAAARTWAYALIATAALGALRGFLLQLGHHKPRHPTPTVTATRTVGPHGTSPAAKPQPTVIATRTWRANERRLGPGPS